MNRRKRIVGVFGLTAVLLSALLLMAPRMIPRDRLAAELRRLAAEQGQADLTLSNVGVRLVPRPTVTLGPGRLVRPPLGGPRSGVDLAWDEVDLAVGLGSLLRGEFAAGAFSARIARAGVGLAVYDDVTVKGRSDGSRVEVTSLRAGLGSGTLEGTATIDLEAGPGGRLEFRVECADVPAVGLLGPWIDGWRNRLEGDLSGWARGSLALGDEAAVRSSLDLEGALFGRGGVLHAGDWLEEARPYLGSRGDLVDVRYERVGHVFTVDQGVYAADLIILGEETDWRVAGPIELAGAMDLAVQVKLPPGFTPDLGQWRFLAETLRDPGGRVNLAFGLVGPWDRPDFRLDLQALLAGANGRDGGEGQDGEKGWAAQLDKWEVR
ncbi:MAG: hypothetical protein AB7V45_15950 [Candidatus Krumholzibacteriia bacterium]